jgi:hypothetical protein
MQDDDNDKNNNNSVLYLFTCLLSSPKASSKVSTATKQTHTCTQKQKTERQGNLYNLDNNSNAVITVMLIMWREGKNIYRHSS